MASKKVEFVRIKKTYPFSYDKKAKYMDYKSDPRSYRAAEGLPQPGYNPNHNLPRPQRVLLDRENITLLPY